MNDLLIKRDYRPPASITGIIDTVIRRFIGGELWPLACRLWSMEDIAEKIEANRPAPAKRGPYKKR